jgi:hypothetical protein
VRSSGHGDVCVSKQELLMSEGKGHKGFWLQYCPQGKRHLMSNVPFGSRYIEGMGTMIFHPMDTI